MPALAQAVLVFTMHGNATADGLQHVAHALVVLDQQGAGGRTHEKLDTRDARKPFELRELARILAGCAHIEREVAMHTVVRTPELVGERLRGGGGRSRVRHFEDGSYASEHRPQRPGFQILLVREAGLAKVHVTIDDARPDVQAATVDHLAGRGPRQIPYRGETAVADAHVSRCFPVLVDNGTAPEGQ